MPPIKKHPDTIAWEKWKESERGKKCLSGDILKSIYDREYLLNRLQCAFQAGIKYGESKTITHAKD